VQGVQVVDCLLAAQARGLAQVGEGHGPGRRLAAAAVDLQEQPAPAPVGQDLLGTPPARRAS
jgi:hypothetical protein